MKDIDMGQGGQVFECEMMTEGLKKLCVQGENRWMKKL